MSDYHVLAFTGRKIRTVMHFATPTGVNAAGKTWAECVVESSVLETGGAPVSSLPAAHIQAAEVTGLANGTLIEQVVAVDSNDDLPVATKRDHVDAEYTRRAALIDSELQHRFRFWGFDRNVP